MAGRVLLLGTDGAPLDLVDRFIAEGVLPNFKRLCEQGTSTESMPSLPPATSVNWTSIASGVHADKHGIVGMRHAPVGEYFTSAPLASAFFSQLCRVPKIYEAAEAQGRDVVLLKYTTSWPPTIGKGIVVDGFGDPGVNVHEVTPRMCFSTRPLKGQDQHADAYRIEPHASAEREGCLEAALEFNLTYGGRHRLDLVIDPKAGQVEIHGTVGPAPTLRVGQWSPWFEFDCEQTNASAPALLALVERKEGPEKKRAAVRAKLLDLSPDGRQLTLYFTRSGAAEGWTQPAGLDAELRKVAGPYFELSGIVFPMFLGWTDADTILEETEMHGEWMAKALTHLLANHPWQLAMSQWHGIDHMLHVFLGFMDPQCIYYDPRKAEGALAAVRRTFVMADRIVGAALKALDADDVLIVTSDHGQIGVRTPGFAVNAWLKQNGYADRAASFGESVIWLNLKGRQREGTVEPGDYEALRSELIQKLEELRDPETGDKIMEVVLRREDATLLGLASDQVGDIVFFLKTEYSKPCRKVAAGEELQAERGIYENCSGEHHAFFPAARRSLGSIRACSFFHGKGVRKGLRLQQPIDLVDLAPTIAHLLGMQPLRNVDGRVVWEVLEQFGG